MIIKYQILFEVDVRHDYYKEFYSRDFSIVPSPACKVLLNRYQLIFRQTSSGFRIYAPAVPKTIPPKLVNSFEGASLKFTFIMQINNSYFDAITSVPEFNPSRELFYFSNLREDIANGTRYLGDQMANARLGEPVKSIPSSILNYKFEAPVNSAQFELTDIFGNPYQLHHAGFSFTDPDEKIDSFQHNLSAIVKFQRGRYLITDDQAGELAFYYNPDLLGKSAFGIIEIFSNTEAFTNPSVNIVPEAYRFMVDDEITGNGAYSIGFEASAWKWMYVCRKNPENSGNGYSVSNLTVEGPVAFSTAGGDDIDERRILSDGPITSAETSVSVILKHSGVKIRDLPLPAMGSTLKTDNNEVFYEMYIYV
jgi:hypothetical protein